MMIPLKAHKRDIKPILACGKGELDKQVIRHCLLDLEGGPQLIGLLVFCGDHSISDELYSAALMLAKQTAEHERWPLREQSWLFHFVWQALNEAINGHNCPVCDAVGELHGRVCPYCHGTGLMDTSSAACAQRLSITEVQWHDLWQHKFTFLCQAYQRWLQQATLYIRSHYLEKSAAA